jgi:hypothetical protein
MPRGIYDRSKSKPRSSGARKRPSTSSTSPSSAQHYQLVAQMALDNGETTLLVEALLTAMQRRIEALEKAKLEIRAFFAPLS